MIDRFGVECGGIGTFSMVFVSTVAERVHLVHLGLPLVFKPVIQRLSTAQLSVSLCFGHLPQ